VTASPASLSTIARFGRFDILGRLALGGMAEIFLAREQGPGRGARAVVVKRILPHVANDPRFVEMFLHEAELAMNLSHANLCAIYEFGEQDGEYFIAMEWVQGVSVTQMHKQLFERGDAGLPAHVVARMGAEIADALSYAHNARAVNGQPLKLVHRDVTPDNIMVGFDGQVKLLDFGVAKAATQRVHTEAGLLKGKFAYMSPEQYQGLELDGRADVFSLGACLYEAVTGLALFHRSSEYETMGAIVSDEPAPRARAFKPDVPQALDEVIARALEKDRRKRFQSAAELHSALERLLVSERVVLRARELGDYVGKLCSELKQQGPKLDTRPEVWTRENQTGRIEKDAMRAALSHALDADEEAMAQHGSRKAWLVRGVLLAVVAGLLAAVLQALQGS
jgi:serine/threonine-protein kinase